VKPIFVANWKMNHTPAETSDFCRSFFELAGVGLREAEDVWIAPPLTSLETLRREVAQAGLLSGIRLGAQNCHWLEKGAHTGEISPVMLTQAGAQFVILGHSERRQFYGESDRAVSERAKAALNAKLRPIVCVGESAEEYRTGRTSLVVDSQLRGSLEGLKQVAGSASLLIAYEPVWAIGTGLAATAEIARSVHAQIRSVLHELLGTQAEAIPILYGGSVKPDNIADFCKEKEINGALIGGASLDPSSYWRLIERGRAANN
jgi:triosephosphate isomerase